MDRLSLDTNVSNLWLPLVALVWKLPTVQKGFRSWGVECQLMNFSWRDQGPRDIEHKCKSTTFDISLLSIMRIIFVIKKFVC